MKNAIKKYFPYFSEVFAGLKLRLKYEMTKRSAKFSIMNSRETIEYIRNNHCSVARFGDGEFSIMMNQRSIGFQEYSEELSESLRDVFQENHPKLLVCIPEYFNNVRGLKKEAKLFWMDWVVNHRIGLQALAGIYPRRKYGNTNVTRPYIDFPSRRTASMLFPMIKSLWFGKDILIVEDEQTRMGVGNDLFCEARSVKRILAPAKNAFACRKHLFNSIVHFSAGKLVLLALGPTATVLAADLSKAGITAYDIGHLDIEYEWFLSNAENKNAVAGKYVNEVENTGCISDVNDKQYLQSILCVLRNKRS